MRVGRRSAAPNQPASWGATLGAEVVGEVKAQPSRRSPADQGTTPAGQPHRTGSFWPAVLNLGQRLHTRVADQVARPNIRTLVRHHVWSAYTGVWPGLLRPWLSVRNKPARASICGETRGPKLSAEKV